MPACYIYAMKIKFISSLCACLLLILAACQTSQSPLQKVQDKTKWKITFGTLSNQLLPAEAQAADYLQRAIDGTVNTYWQSRAEAHAGMYLDLDLNTPRKLHGVVLDSSGKALAEDYPHGIVIYGATKEGEWKELARDYNNKPVDGKVTMEFTSVEVRYLRLQLLGGAPNKWWSVAEIDLLE
jgi:hypothetical protein